MTEKILVPLDLSHAGAKVLDTAREMAERRGAKLIILTVLPTVPAIVDSFMPSNYQNEAVKETRIAVEKRLEEKGIAKDAYEIVIRHGTPYDEVINYAKEINANVIVVASHAPKTAADYLLGTTASKIVRHASCSVFVVRV
jgi:nucleotide-binding universal stress UspA family protein